MPHLIEKSLLFFKSCLLITFVGEKEKNDPCDYHRCYSHD